MKPKGILRGAAVIAASIATVHAADYVKAYTRGSGSQLIKTNGGAGTVLFVDEAATGNADMSADGGNPTWGWEVDGSGSWSVGDRVEFTGIAMPIWANDPTTDGSGNTQNATHRIRIYSCGANNSFDGAESDTLIDTVDVSFGLADAGVDEYYVNFDSPVDWVAADSTSFYFYIQAIELEPGSGMAMRFKSGAPGAGSVIKNRNTGAGQTVSGATTTRLSVAGIVNRVERRWFGDDEDVVSSDAADWDTNSTFWDGGAAAYSDGDFVTFDEGFDGISNHVNLVGSLSPGSIVVDNTAGGLVPEYVFSGTGGLSGPTGLVRSGNGMLTIENAGVNDYAGGTLIETGSITLGRADALPTSGSLALGSGSGTAELRMNGFDQTIATLSNSGSNTRRIVNGVATPVVLTVTDGGAYSSQIGNAAVEDADDDNRISLVKTGAGELNLVGGNNSYNGTTTISGGTLWISADNGLGSVPTSPVAGSIVLNGGTLRVHMAGNTGGSFAIDPKRLITLGGDGATIQATTPSGAWVVSYDGVISGIGSLTKTAGQTLQLGGTNTYTGATIIDGGTFRLTGSLVSEVTVQSGVFTTSLAGQLGNGSTGGLVMDGGRFSLFIDSSTISSGVATVSGSVDIDPTATFDVTDIAGTQAVLTPGDKLTVIDYSGGSLSGNFSGLTEGERVEVGPNSFTISYADGDKVTLTTVPANPYDAWAATNITDIAPGASAGFDEDADEDGLVNGLEWILGGSPLDGKLVGVLPVAVGDATSGLTMVFDRNADSLGNTTLSVEWDTDLTTWGNAIPIVADIAPNGDEPTVTIVGDQVSVNIPGANAAGGKIFARLDATQP